MPLNKETKTPCTSQLKTNFFKHLYIYIYISGINKHNSSNFFLYEKKVNFTTQIYLSRETGSRTRRFWWLGFSRFLGFNNRLNHNPIFWYLSWIVSTLSKTTWLLFRILLNIYIYIYICIYIYMCVCVCVCVCNLSLYIYFKRIFQIECSKYG